MKLFAITDNYGALIEILQGPADLPVSGLWLNFCASTGTDPSSTDESIEAFISWLIDTRGFTRQDFTVF